MDPKELKRVRMVKRIAQEFPDGALVNLGIGMPTMVANYIPEGRTILLQSENGFTGLGPAAQKGRENQSIVNAGGQAVTIVPGGAFFDSAMSFAIIRGGHVDYTVLGGLEVDMEGNLANYMIPGKMVPGMGGAMDLVAGAKNVIVAMEHVSKNGAPKILKKCSLPLTAKGGSRPHRDGHGFHPRYEERPGAGRDSRRHHGGRSNKGHRSPAAYCGKTGKVLRSFLWRTKW